MECLALAPLKFTVWSSDFSLIRTNLFVNAHPKAKVARLLQYVHSRLSAELNASGDDAMSRLAHVSEYYFHYKHQELSLDTYLQDVEPMHGQGFIRVRFERKKSNSGSAQNLDYDLDYEFATTNLQLNVNVLSVDKIMSVYEPRVSMGMTMARLEKLAVQRLHEYEVQDKKNLCGLKDRHSPSDLVGFIFKGKQTPIQLDAPNSLELYNDMTLSEVLGYDFAPENGSHFTVMFKVRHNLDSVDGEDSLKLEFVSDATLSANEMRVTPDTTVEEVKEFICSVYTHSLSLSTNDIKLIYKGQLVHVADFAGNASKIMEYINEPGSAKIHVQINQDFNEPGPGFWSELFNSPEAFDFIHRRNQTEEVTSQPMMHSTSARSQAASLPANEMPASIQRTENRRYRYVTRSGLIVHSSHESYIRCTVDGKEVYVPAQELDPITFKLEAGEHSISASSADCIVENGLIKLSPNLIARLESRLGTSILKDIFIAQELNPSNGGNMGNFSTESGRGQRAFRIVSSLRNGFPIVLLLVRTLYLIGNYSIIPLFFLMRLSELLPRKYIILIAVLYILRAIWSTREIWDMWTSYMNSNVVNETNYREIKDYISSGSLSSEFYGDCRNHPAVIDILMASNLRELRSDLYDAYSIPNAVEQGNGALTSLFERVHARELNKQPMDAFLVNCLDLYETNRDTTPSSYLDSFKELLLLAHRDQDRTRALHDLPWYKKFVRVTSSQLRRFRRRQLATKIFERIVPDPATDNFFLAVVKNLLLFVCILFPQTKSHVDIVLQQRSNRRAHQETSLRDLEPAVQPEPEPVPDQPAGASGLQLHPEQAQD
ncbi:hypothetical protein HG536_0A05910 [Torulaspora globosa]|uniref:Ubiquitin-like domain-containing protein n=1 Tax=Torulaspora globosa TaxID=48254 RepID=A0A7G3ZB90_9SACH|nr:uncharacterized protein HG536_0A05910 [Torulaspora globosa]QLL30776.1 hypothetical protein HG536_0A05910 [Torulaspora globosa]